jgi:hypothetical protein
MRSRNKAPAASDATNAASAINPEVGLQGATGDEFQMIWRILNSFVDTRGGAVGATAAPATRASGVKVPQTIN